MNTPLTEVTSYLTVTRVGTGGNSRGGGKYLYEFDPELINITKTPTLLRFQLSKQTAPNFAITDLFTTDSKFQLRGRKIEDGGRVISMLNDNTAQQLIFISLQLWDSDAQEIVNCDPQVTNTPETTPPVSVGG
jgi:hypothetical protein